MNRSVRSILVVLSLISFSCPCVFAADSQSDVKKYRSRLSQEEASVYANSLKNLYYWLIKSTCLKYYLVEKKKTAAEIKRENIEKLKREKERKKNEIDSDGWACLGSCAKGEIDTSLWSLFG